MVICLERDADLHTAQLMPLPLSVSCISKIQIGFTFLVPAHPGSPEKLGTMYFLLLIMFNIDIFVCSFCKKINLFDVPGFACLGMATENELIAHFTATSTPPLFIW